jgi:ribonuclease P/MRP protein subunit RPP40
MAVLKLLDSVIDSLDRGEFSAAIFLDFSKAFDTVNHRILLDKLNHYGIRGVANKWVESYLEGRTQFCTFNNSTSNYTKVTCGVPQGSILGPLLFLIYVNDLGTIFNSLKTILFADDSNLVATGKTLLDVEQSLNSEIPVLVDWLRTNRLSLN